MFDQEKLIREVKLQPVIYDKSKRSGDSKNLLEEAWFRVGEAMYEDWNDLTDEQKKRNGMFTRN